MTKVICLYGGPGCGKCLRKDTTVLMYNGEIKRIDTIKIGDKLMGPDSNPRTVLEINRGFDEMYEIKPNKGESQFVTLNHRLPLLHSGKKNSRRNNQLFNLTVKEYLDLPTSWKEKLKLYRVGITFNKKQLKIPPYILGLWLGDGSSCGPEITTMDNEIETNWKNYADYMCLQVKQYRKPNNHASTFKLSSGRAYHNTAKRLLQSYNLINNKHIPFKYLTASKEQRLQLLAGLLDSDGYCNKGFEITQKNAVLADNIVYLSRSLGFAAYKKETVKCDQHGTKGVYQKISISGKLHIIPTKLLRKRAPIRKINKNQLKTGFVIHKTNKIEEYVGLTVSGDHLFVLGDFSVTHNSTTAAKLFSVMKEKGYKVELVREWVKNWAYDNKPITYFDQLYITAKQAKAEYDLHGKVDYIITDSPLMISAFYSWMYNNIDVNPIVLDVIKTSKENGIVYKNYFIKRNKPYDENGRYQNEDEAKQIDDKMKTYLYNDNIEYKEINGAEEILNEI